MRYLKNHGFDVTKPVTVPHYNKLHQEGNSELLFGYLTSSQSNGNTTNRLIYQLEGLL